MLDNRLAVLLMAYRHTLSIHFVGSLVHLRCRMHSIDRLVIASYILLCIKQRCNQYECRHKCGSWYVYVFLLIFSCRFERHRKKKRGTVDKVIELIVRFVFEIQFFFFVSSILHSIVIFNLFLKLNFDFG